jgi:hypothetical protein
MTAEGDGYRDLSAVLTIGAPRGGAVIVLAAAAAETVDDKMWDPKRPLR